MDFRSQVSASTNWFPPQSKSRKKTVQICTFLSGGLQIDLHFLKASTFTFSFFSKLFWNFFKTYYGHFLKQNRSPFDCAIQIPNRLRTHENLFMCTVFFSWICTGIPGSRKSIRGCADYDDYYENPYRERRELVSVVSRLAPSPLSNFQNTTHLRSCCK